MHTALFADDPMDAMRSLAGVDPVTRRALAERCQPRRLVAGEVLYRAGDEVDAVHFVQSGSLVAYLDAPDGRREVVGRIGIGEAVGEMALITGKPRSTHVAALRDARLLIADAAMPPPRGSRRSRRPRETGRCTTTCVFGHARGGGGGPRASGAARARLRDPGVAAAGDRRTGGAGRWRHPRLAGLRPHRRGRLCACARGHRGVYALIGAGTPFSVSTPICSSAPAAFARCSVASLSSTVVPCSLLAASRRAAITTVWP